MALAALMGSSLPGQAAITSGDLATVELRAHSEVIAPCIHLSDVAAISSDNASLREKLQSLPLGCMETTGEPSNMEQATIAHWIRLRAGVDPHRLSWVGAMVAHVRLAVTTVVGDRIATVAMSGLKRSLAISSKRCEIELAQVPQDVQVPAGELVLKVRNEGATGSATSGMALRQLEESPAVRQMVWVELWVAGRFIRSVPVVFSVRQFGPALVAAADLPIGQQLGVTRNDGALVSEVEVEWSGRLVAPLPVQKPFREGDSFAAKGTGIAMRLRRPVAAGQILTRADVEPMPTVTQGSFATLNAFQGGVAMQTRVEVLEDGSTGRSVRVRLPNASSSIMARVTGPAELEVVP